MDEMGMYFGDGSGNLGGDFSIGTWVGFIGTYHK